MESTTLDSIAEIEVLRSVPDDELLHRLGEIVTRTRHDEADLVAHIGEVDRRRLFARRAFPSMFAYCTQALHLSEAEAYRRITVARAARQYEGLLDRLKDGRLHLTGMALIVPVLTPENCQSVLTRVTHRSKREIQQLVAELSPRPDVPAVIRKLPQKRMAAAAGGQLVPETARGPLAGLEPREGPELMAPTTRNENPGASELPNAQSTPAVVEPLSPTRYKVQFTASQELRDKLERLTALMRSEVPDGDLATIVERAISEKLQRLEARRFGKARAPRKTLADTVVNPASRYLPAALRRAVHERDEGRCSFVDQQGRRCTERHRLEFHHHFPFGKGGDPGLGNIRLLCEQHNRHLAEVDYGRSTVQGKVEDSRRRREERLRPEGTTEQA